MPRKDKNVRYLLGMPYRWEPHNLLKEFWNPEDDRLFPPKHFGWGWSFNFHALGQRVGLLKKPR